MKWFIQGLWGTGQAKTWSDLPTQSQHPPLYHTAQNRCSVSISCPHHCLIFHVLSTVAQLSFFFLNAVRLTAIILNINLIAHYTKRKKSWDLKYYMISYPNIIHNQKYSPSIFSSVYSLIKHVTGMHIFCQWVPVFCTCRVFTSFNLTKLAPIHLCALQS